MKSSNEIIHIIILIGTKIPKKNFFAGRRPACARQGKTTCMIVGPENI
jgi:hypothetical protein